LIWFDLRFNPLALQWFFTLICTDQHLTTTNRRKNHGLTHLFSYCGGFMRCWVQYLVLTWVFDFFYWQFGPRWGAVFVPAAQPTFFWHYTWAVIKKIVLIKSNPHRYVYWNVHHSWGRRFDSVALQFLGANKFIFFPTFIGLFWTTFFILPTMSIFCVLKGKCGGSIFGYILIY
jgi:hypothetical protein